MSSSQHVVDVDQASFDEEVLERSHQIPVMVDFWAAWCGPCRTLAPMLERVTDEHAGAVRLAKVDVDRNGDLAARYGVRGLPTVKLFKDGVPVDEFVGAQPESTVHALLARHVERASDGDLARAETLVEQGRSGEARAVLEQALADDPANDRIAPALAEVFLALGELDEAESLLRAQPANVRPDPPWQRVEALLEVARAAAGNDGASSEQAERYARAARLALEQRYEESMDGMLDIVRQDRGFGNDAARKAMLAIFTILGDHDPRVRTYRSRLASALH